MAGVDRAGLWSSGQRPPDCIGQPYGFSDAIEDFGHVNAMDSACDQRDVDRTGDLGMEPSTVTRDSGDDGTPFERPHHEQKSRRSERARRAAQDLYGQTADMARQSATTIDAWLRETIETQPYTTAIVALGIGWLLGRLHRPL
jgi:hypothetical protein